MRIKWPFRHPRTGALVLVKPSHDFTEKRNYDGTTFNPFGWHMGADFAVPSGTKVVAPCDLTITRAGTYGDLGKVVWGVDKYGREWGFAHLSVIGDSVKPGAKFKAGQLLARTGSTGNSTGPHCHAHRTARKTTGGWGSAPYEDVYPDYAESYYAAGGR